MTSCRCGNDIDDGKPFRTNVIKCRCPKPGPGRRRARLNSTLLGCVRKTWDDFENDQIADARHGQALMRDRERQRRENGDRLVYGG